MGLTPVSGEPCLQLVRACSALSSGLALCRFLSCSGNCK